MSRYTKGQIEMNETIFVLFFIVLILAIGMVVYYRYFVENVQETAGQLSEQEASVLLASIIERAELRCSQGDCIDTSKIIPFSQVVKAHSSHYLRELGYKRITLEIMYPRSNSTRLCDLQAYQQSSYPENCASYIVYEQRLMKSTGKIVVGTPVSIYYPELNEYRIGRLVIESYA